MNTVIGLAMIAVVLFVAPLIGVVFGAFSGLVVGMFFGPTIKVFLYALSPQASLLELWQLGAGLGFIGGFFKSTTINKD